MITTRIALLSTVISLVSAQGCIPPPGLFCCPKVGPSGLPLQSQQTGPFSIFCNYGSGSQCYYNPLNGSGSTVSGCPSSAPINCYYPTPCPQQ